MKILEQINEHPTNSKLAVIIRHADRDNIPLGSFGNEVLLNRKGVENSMSLGEKMRGHKVNCIYTSPILRCIQTAEYFENGYGKPLDYNITKSLGDPGLHIEDDKLAGEFYLKHTFDEMYRRFTNNEPIPGVPSPKDFKQRMNEFIKDNTKEEGITFFVTHDSLIAFYHYCLNGTIYTKENWIQYLSGIVLKID